MLATTENWLYGDGDDSTKAKYIAKYEELASLGNIIRGRYLAKEEEKRQALRANQETSKMNDIAEKLAEQRRARAASDDSDDNNDENMDLD